MLKKIITGTLIAIIVIAVAAFGFVYYLSHRPLPDYNGRVTLKGLTGEVTVYRDQYAVPHIYARNELDLYRAVGYCMAQDRLFQMDLIRRLTSGRLSEVVGEKAVDVDLLMRTLRLSEKSQRMYEQSDKLLLGYAEAFSDGVNQYIEKHRNKLPVEFTILGYKIEKWEPVNLFNIASYFAFDLTTAWDTEILFHKIAQKIGGEKVRALIPDVPGEREVIYPQFSVNTSELELRESILAAARLIDDLGLTFFQGSNNWAVSGKRTETGRPLFANDMHLGLNAPGIWYQMHQVVEGKLNVTGVMAPGQPFIVAGHNEHIAWGMTNVMVDDMDFYLEKINPDNPDQYLFDGQWKDMEVRKEKIKVKGGKVVEKEIRFTRHGPIISGLKGVKEEAISMRWIGNEDSNEARSLYLLDRAGNWDDFKSALRTFRSVCQNVDYADTAGNIGLYCAAGIPIRAKGDDGISIRPGWTSEYDWQGFVPFEEQPHTYNPAAGFVLSANNKTVGNDYPYYISTWFATDYRYRRIKEMLEASDKISIDYIRQMQADFKSKLVEDIKPDLVSSLEKTGDLTPVEQECLQKLKAWDGVLTRESIAATIFETFNLEFARNIFRDELGDELGDKYLSLTYIVNQALDRLWQNRSSSWYDDISTPDRKESFDDIAGRSFKGAIKWLGEKYGPKPSKWQWGNCHRLTLEHPLGSVKILDRIFNFNRGPYAVGGAGHTVCPYQYKSARPFKVVHGASHRHIYSPGNWDDSLSVIPTGTSGIPASKYYCDQTRLYVNHEYHHDYFSRELVEKNARYVMRLNAE